MNVSFYGAAKEVTGSCYCVENNGIKLLIDCGLQQGQDEKDDQRLPFEASEIDFLILTHAHMDHSGRVPLLVKQGFKGKIFATKATCDLCEIMLKDSAHIQEMDAMWENKKRKRSGEDEVVPLYTVPDAQKALEYFEPCSYNEVFEIADGIKVCFVDAGHILGSSSIELYLKEGAVSKKIVFSGDIGNTNQPIIKDPQYIKQADYVVMEATYGDKDHEKSEDYTVDLANIINDTLSRGGNVLIPSFAVGRTQDLLYFIRDMKERKLVPGVPNFPVYIDSPLATAATKIYDGNLTGNADEQAAAVMKRGVDPMTFADLRLVESTDESKALNFDTTPKVIISSSGMCEAGRIRHHLKHNLWRKDSAVVFVGYQANGTLGRLLLDGIKKVKLFGEEIAVVAAIHNFPGLSAHADKTGLLKWIGNYAPKPQKVFIIHGEEEVCEEFAGTLNGMGFSALAPLYTSVYDLATGELVSHGVEIEKKEKTAEYHAGKPAEKAKETFAYISLLNAGELLLDVIRRNKGGANRDLEKFAKEVTALAKSWHR